MKVSGRATVAAPVAQVWDALRDPAVLARTIPGCERLEAVGPDDYAMTISAGVAAIKGTYTGRVALSDPRPPHAFVLTAQGQGAPGTVNATVRINLSEAEGGTAIDYDADAVVGGMVGGVGQRMLAAVSKRTAAQFFAAVERQLAAPVGVPGAVPAGAVPDGAVASAPALGGAPGAPGVVHPVAPPVTVSPVAYGGARPSGESRAMAVGFVAGGALALAGVAVGWAMGRRSRRP